MHEKICCDPESQMLQEIMVRYNEWLRSLSSNQLAHVLTLSTEERIAEIKRIVAQQEKERFNELVKRALRPEDYEAMIRWFEDRVLSRLPPDLQAQVALHNDPRRRRYEMVRLYRQHTNNEPLFESDPLTEQEIQLLTDQLSAKAREALGKAEDTESRNRIVRDWIGAGFFSSFRPHVSERELMKYLAEHVNEQQREYLEHLPRERMMSELRRLYGISRIQRTFGEPGRWPFRMRRHSDFRHPKGRSLPSEKKPPEDRGVNPPSRDTGKPARRPPE
jgi:hypothetical protein